MGIKQLITLPLYNNNLNTIVMVTICGDILCSYLLFKYLSGLKKNALVHVVQNHHHKCDWETRTITVCVYTPSDALI